MQRGLRYLSCVFVCVWVANSACNDVLVAANRGAAPRVCTSVLFIMELYYHLNLSIDS